MTGDTSTRTRLSAQQPSGASEGRHVWHDTTGRGSNHHCKFCLRVMESRSTRISHEEELHPENVGKLSGPGWCDQCKSVKYQDNRGLNHHACPVDENGLLRDGWTRDVHGRTNREVVRVPKRVLSQHPIRVAERDRYHKQKKWEQLALGAFEVSPSPASAQVSAAATDSELAQAIRPHGRVDSHPDISSPALPQPLPDQTSSSNLLTGLSDIAEQLLCGRGTDAQITQMFASAPAANGGRPPIGHVPAEPYPQHYQDWHYYGFSLEKHSSHSSSFHRRARPIDTAFVPIARSTLPTVL